MWALRPAGQLRAASRCLSSAVGLQPTLDFLAQFVNYERKGVPFNAGTDSAEGFDLVRPAKAGRGSSAAAA